VATKAIAWLSGVRQVGKTTLAQCLDGAMYLSCDLPSSADRIADPEGFLRSVEAPVLILDEIHQFPDPSRLLKIAADAFLHLRVLAMVLDPGGNAEVPRLPHTLAPLLGAPFPAHDSRLGAQPNGFGRPRRLVRRRRLRGPRH